MQRGLNAEKKKKSVVPKNIKPAILKGDKTVGGNKQSGC